MVRQRGHADENRSQIETLRTLTYDGRVTLTGRSGGKQAWGVLSWDGQTDETMATFPDGRDVWETLQSGDLSTLPECWIKLTNTGALGDMMWSDAMIFCFVSDRFVQVLRSEGFGGFQVLPLEVVPKRGTRFAGYSLLLPDNASEDAPIRSFPFVFRPTVTLDVSGEVIAALTAAGVTDFETHDATVRGRELIESE